jgi:hypothetical protein
VPGDLLAVRDTAMCKPWSRSSRDIWAAKRIGGPGLSL